MDMTNHPLLSALTDDPPPFPPNYPQFARFDRAIQCGICKEPFASPVSVTCGHSFCSQCIRSYLDEMKKKCPACDAQISEASIRRNRALEDMTDAWEAARPTIMTFCTNAQAGPSRRRPDPPSKPSSSNSVKRRRDESPSRSRSPSKVRKLDGDVLELLDSEDADVSEEMLDENDDGECPICQARLPIASIPLHIERGCPPPKSVKEGSGNQKQDWKKVFAGAGSAKDKNVKMERIRKPNYAMAQPTELRTLLSKYDVPTAGDQSALVWRVKQWIIIFNANLDTSHPQSISALRAKLKSAEAARQKEREKGKEDKIADIDQYAREKKSEFERLRRDIMERDKKKRQLARASPEFEIISSTAGEEGLHDGSVPE